jgi:UDP-glucose 4-epimerase
MVMDIERAKKELGYRPQYDLEAGARDYIESMKRLGIKPMAVT